MYDIPADDPAWELYRDAKWMKDVPEDVRNYAAMVSMVDRQVGEVPVEKRSIEFGMVVIVLKLEGMIRVQWLDEIFLAEGGLVNAVGRWFL